MRGNAREEFSLPEEKNEEGNNTGIGGANFPSCTRSAPRVLNRLLLFRFKHVDGVVEDYTILFIGARRGIIDSLAASNR
jgi:hypothetical protein